MDDLDHGYRDKRGDWKPADPVKPAPLFIMPPKPLALAKWLPHYFLPYNLLWALSAVIWWQLFVPDKADLQTLSLSWIAPLFIANCAALFMVFGAVEWHLYRRRAQGARFKYNAKWPSEHRSAAFLFQRQTIDGLIRTFGTGMPIWTALQVAILWAYGNNHAPWLAFAENPLYLAMLALIVPIIHETHFYVLHRLLHVGPLYKRIHSVHHNSVNPSPWSSLSMHPVEQLGYLGVALWHLVIPSHPIIALYQLHYAGFGAIPGHIGFHRIETGPDKAIDSHAYLHYLHHKHFEVNYGDGLVPFDRIFGTFHDGSPDGEAKMKARFNEIKKRAKRKREAQT
jgi:sterol desaturase/sphingolipid hydroxylase (fatty acid hydroxylase superfamily)